MATPPGSACPSKSGQDYVPRFGWVDRHTLWMETVLRDHQHRYIDFVDIGNGQGRQVVEITDDKFLDENYDVSVGEGNIVLTNWKDGHNHLYLYSLRRRGIRWRPQRLRSSSSPPATGMLPPSRWSIPCTRLVYYTSNESNVTGATALAGRLRRQAQATHHRRRLPRTQFFAQRRRLRRQTTRPTMTPPQLQPVPDRRPVPRLLVQPRPRSLQSARAGEPRSESQRRHHSLRQHSLACRQQTAAAFVPLIVNPYGGPGAQTVNNKWSDSLLFDELLAQHGFAVLHADNRGTCQSRPRLCAGGLSQLRSRAA